MGRRNLTQLEIGQAGCIYELNTSRGALRRRLIDMGMLPYTEVKVKRIAPMGDPIEISIRGYSLSLRREDAEKIVIMDDAERETLHADMQAHLRRRRELGARQLGDVVHADRSDADEHKRAASLTRQYLSFSKPCATGKDKQACAAEVSNDDRPVKLALVGNPNCGKTTLFNAMTGSREYVGNWPGVTVEKKEGRVKGVNAGRKSCASGICTMGHEMTLVDLPGIYSLSPHTMEEVISRDFVIRDKPDAIINIVDGTNLERNLYLTVQLMELEVPMIIALNMMDEVERMGHAIDCERLSEALGIPVVPISARTGQGVTKLVESAQRLIQAAHLELHEGFNIEPDDIYDEYTHAYHHRIGQIIAPYAEAAGLRLHWAEIKALEGDVLVLEALKLPPEAERAVRELMEEYSGADAMYRDSELMLAHSRYSYIDGVVAESLHRRRGTVGEEASDRIDAVLTNKVLAIPLFILIMLSIFALTFSTAGAWLSDGVGALIDDVINPAVEAALASIGAADWFVSLVCDGIITGVGGVLTFLPQIALLFFFLSLLEDSGYMSRIAFIMDRPMRRFGLSGKSFIPLLMGFGCTVPATMGARTMENERDKRMTILLLPFMSCSAKLPVYALIAGAFFGGYSWLVIIGLYVFGILVGIVSGLLFKKNLFGQDDSKFLIELPPYRLPSMKNVLLNVWEKVKHFMERAGTIILAMSVVLWFLMSFDLSFALVENEANSILGRLGTVIAPVFAPQGFGFWQAAVALLCGLVAKEAVVSAMAVFYGFAANAAGGEVLAAMGGSFSALSALSFLVFVLLYTPCAAAVVTMRRELGSGKYTLFAVAYQIGVAYLVSALVYQFGRLVGYGDINGLFIIITLLIVALSCYWLIRALRGKGDGCSDCASCGKRGSCRRGVRMK
ncbi:MAG: ferrous iron transport protein B [Clostridia bacterium]|nr:ferrous iron transport protein B [Clostridia bacterium]